MQAWVLTTLPHAIIQMQTDQIAKAEDASALRKRLANCRLGRGRSADLGKWKLLDYVMRYRQAIPPQVAAESQLRGIDTIDIPVSRTQDANLLEPEY